MSSAKQILLGKAALRILPNLYQRSSARWARQHLSVNAVFLLSFDCDTNRDAEASLKIQEYLHTAGIRAAYAVPGQLLEKHWNTYKELLSLGGYFINHGFLEHAAISTETGRPFSTFTYRDTEESVWQNDILQGHQTIQSLTGQTPVVFRTPHFGEFNTIEQLNKLYDFLLTLGYRVSTSTTPVMSFTNGSVYNCKHDLREIPLSGCLSRPSQLIDSWGFISAPDALGREKLLSELKKYLSLLSSGKRALVNIYFDPADIAEDQEILDLLIKFKPFCGLDYVSAALLSAKSPEQ